MNSERHSRKDLRVERIERRTELPMLLLALFYIPIFILVELPETPPNIRHIANFADYAIILIFAIELAIRVAVAEHRLRYLRSHWVDVVIIVLPFLRPLRVLAALRFLRVVIPLLVVMRRHRSLRRVVGARRGLYILILGILSVSLSATFVTEFEHGARDSPIQSYADAIWWAVETITTVGYGDMVPITPGGRFVGVCLMFIGIALFGVLTATVAAFFVEEETETEQVRMARLVTKIDSLERRIEEQNRLISQLIGERENHLQG